MIRHMLLGIPPTVHAAGNEAKAAEKKCENCPGVCKPSELPIYPKDSCKCRNPIVSDVSFVYKAIEAPVATVRVQVQEAVNKFLVVNSQIKDSYDNTINNTRWVMRYLREEDHEQQRLGAVAVGTLSGFIFGLRGGIFKRLWYASIGTGIMGAICFPEQSEVVARETFNNGKYLAKISYNFLYGVKPGDPQPEFNFPELKLPQNFSEFVDLSTSIAKSIKNSVSPPPSSNEDKKPSEDKKNKTKMQKNHSPTLAMSATPTSETVTSIKSEATAAAVVLDPNVTVEPHLNQPPSLEPIITETAEKACMDPECCPKREKYKKENK